MCCNYNAIHNEQKLASHYTTPYAPHHHTTSHHITSHHITPVESKTRTYGGGVGRRRKGAHEP